MITALTIGNALLAGTYFAFSAMVMPALARVGEAGAADAMRAINRAAERGPFIALFAGTAVLAGVVVAGAAVRPSQGDSLSGGAGALALLGTAVTVFGNVPLNRRLDRVGAAAWNDYRRRWTRLNTARAAAHLAGVLLVASAR